MTAKADIDPSIAETVERVGFLIVPDALSPELVDRLSRAIAEAPSGNGERGVYKRNRVYAMRNLFDLVPDVKEALAVPAVQDVVEAILGRDAFCVRGLFLDRAPREGWKVPWRQDALVTVKGRIDVTGFGPWPIKSGVQHVMAPPGTLSAMLTVRLYLDDCGERDGALRVVSGSHQYGRLPEDSIEQFTRYDVTPCAVPRGGLLAMRPLLLRKADPAETSGPRKVLHFDFASRRLPLPLEWHESHPLFAE